MVELLIPKHPDQQYPKKYDRRCFEPIRFGSFIGACRENNLSNFFNGNRSKEGHITNLVNLRKVTDDQAIWLAISVRLKETSKEILDFIFKNNFIRIPNTSLIFRLVILFICLLMIVWA